jgi:hypothetical protein
VKDYPVTEATDMQLHTDVAALKTQMENMNFNFARLEASLTAVTTALNRRTPVVQWVGIAVASLSPAAIVAMALYGAVSDFNHQFESLRLVDQRSVDDRIAIHAEIEKLSKGVCAAPMPPQRTPVTLP